jgi:cell division GTPase FtsZ
MEVIVMFNLILGCGQGGSRLAKEISDTFNIPGRYINLADIDYSSFDVPRHHKLIVDGDGTGRSAELGEKITRDNFDTISKFIDDSIRLEEVNWLCMCIGGGGGSGTGLMIPILEHLTDKYPKLNILLLYTLPRKLEGLPAKPQALTYLNRLVKNFMSGKKQIAPVIIDNEYASTIYAEGLDTDYEYWVRVNRGIANTLKAFYNLTRIDSVDHIDSASGFGALDYNELLSVLFFKNGFVDFRDFELDYPDNTEISEFVRKSSKVFKDLDVRTCKAYIIAVAMPDRWKGHKETNDFVDAVFDIVSKATKTTYVLRSSFYSRRMTKARIMCLFAGLTKGKGLERIIKQTAKDAAKFDSKSKATAFDLSSIKKTKK